MTPAPRQHFYPALDGLRFLAIVGVVLYHYLPHRLPGGFLGVDVFLVLSGFLTTQSLMAREQAHEPLVQSLRDYSYKRLIRIGIPLLWMVLIVVSGCFLFNQDFLYQVRGSVLSSLFYVNNWWQIAQGASYFDAYAQAVPLTHLWYLGIQMQLYLILPMLLVFMQARHFSRGKRGLSFFILALLSTLAMAFLFKEGQDPSRVYYGTDTRAFGFFLGAVAACWWRPAKMDLGKYPWLTPCASLLGFFSLAGLLALCFHLQAQATITYRGGIFLGAFLAMVFMLSLTIKSNPLSKLFALKPLRFLGRGSFSCYLWYYPVYSLSNGYPFLRDRMGLQMLILFVLSMISFLGVEQAFTNHFLHGHHLREGIKKLWEGNKRKPISYVMSFFVLGLVTCFTVAMVVAPQGKNPETLAMERQIEKNAQQLLQQGGEKDASLPSADLPALLRHYSQKQEITAIGDSVLLAAAPPLKEAFPHMDIDAAVSRQFSEGIAILEDKKSKGLLKDKVIIMLGTNGAIRDEDMQALLLALDGRETYFITTHVPRSWEGQVNKLLTQTAYEQSMIKLVDWQAFVAGHDDWLYGDEIHPNDEGAKGFTHMLARSLYYQDGQINTSYGSYLSQAVKGVHP